MQEQDSPNTEKRVCLTQPKEILQLNKKSVSSCERQQLSGSAARSRTCSGHLWEVWILWLVDTLT